MHSLASRQVLSYLMLQILLLSSASDKHHELSWIADPDSTRLVCHPVSGLLAESDAYRPVRLHYLTFCQTTAFRSLIAWFQTGLVCWSVYLCLASRCVPCMQITSVCFVWALCEDRHWSLHSSRMAVSAACETGSRLLCSLLPSIS